MEELIIKIVEQLLAISIGFVGLLFTSLSILMTINDDNWKIKKLKQTKQFKDFVTLNVNTSIGFVFLFIFSIILLLINELKVVDKTFIYFIYIYLFVLMYLSFKVILIAYRYKQIIYLMLDNSKPIISE